ncbi:(4Fe-4S)-binding protein [Oscillatoria amoena NRMC-F 0135]|nr:(4Fe-4S)-binding protein [Oscillatoria amoena NRMC-F 0135]
MDRKITKKYTNGEVTVVWQPDKCIHSTLCFTGLPKVFNPRERPWITPEGGTTQQIIDQVKKCPSGALSYFMNDEENKEEAHLESVIEVLSNGPLLIYGTLKLKDKNGEQTLENKTTALCRCGQSSNKPFCDGTHAKVNFQG